MSRDFFKNCNENYKRMMRKKSCNNSCKVKKTLTKVWHKIQERKVEIAIYAITTLISNVAIMQLRKK